MNFYNTILLTGDDLKKAVQDAKSLEAAVLLVFQNTGKSYTPSGMLNIMTIAGHKYPLTSIRRSLSDLTKDGLLIKRDEMKTGLYNLPEHFWSLKSKP